MSSITGCTLIYTEELPQAAVLANSFLRFHPEAEFVVLVIDGLPGQASIPKVKTLSLGDLGLDSGEEWRLPMLFGRDELRTYLEPVLLETLLRTSAGPVACFSASTQIFDSVSDILDKVRNTGAVVATELIENKFGDTGRSFVGVPPGGGDLLSSKEATIAICRAGFAVHYLNLDPASLRRESSGYEVGGERLRSFDFRGYDPNKPHLLSRFQGFEPRILLSEWPLVAELCDAYREELVQAGYSPGRTAHRRFEVLPSGLRLDARILRIYRDAFSKFRLGAQPEPPSPFGPEGEEGFLNWLNEPIDRAGKGVTRFMLAVYEDRPDVKSAYPDPTNANAADFRNWYLLFGAKELSLPAALIPRRSSTTSVVSASVPVNVAGFFRAELGIGTAARALVAALDAAQIPINTITFDRTANRLAHPFVDRSSAAGAADINLVCINPDQIHVFAEQVGPDFWNGRYNIGLWFWEVEDFPASLQHAFNYVDEIWVASDFMRQTFLRVSAKPVFKYRLPVMVPTVDPSMTRSQLGLPAEFVFLFSFDFLSVLERKNPLGLIEAFRRAFKPGEGPRLVLKTINGDKRTLEVEKLKYAIRGRSDILLMDGYLPAVENASVAAMADCYVSLHRSEGFGLTIAEAMVLGKPAIATAYSGNLEFMTEENSYLCPARRSEVGPEREPYPAESHWSEPDLAAAANLLRRVYADREEAQARGARAAADLRSTHSAAVAGKVISDRLSVIRSRRANEGPSPSLGLLQDRIDELELRLAERRLAD